LISISNLFPKLLFISKI